MDILKFNENLSVSDRSFHEHGKDINQRIVDTFNSKGYKLYYYKDFELIEIESIGRIKLGRSNWKKEWGNLIFFLNDTEFVAADRVNKKCKELYDMHLKQAELETEMPMSYIYHNILKKKEE